MAFYNNEDAAMRRAAMDKLMAQEEQADAQRTAEKKSAYGTAGGIVGAIIAAATGAPPQVGYQLGSGVGRIAADPSAKSLESEVTKLGGGGGGVDITKLLSMMGSAPSA